MAADDTVVTVVPTLVCFVVFVKERAGRYQDARQQQRRERDRPVRLHQGSVFRAVIVLVGCAVAPAQSSSTMVMAFQLFIGMSKRFRFES